MASDEIAADYDQLAQVASRFTNQSEKIQQMMQNLSLIHISEPTRPY